MGNFHIPYSNFTVTYLWLSSLGFNVISFCEQWMQMYKYLQHLQILKLLQSTQTELQDYMRET